MRLNTLIMRALDWPVVLGERLRDWLEAGDEKRPQQCEQSPLDRHCYLMGESHLSGYRLVIGFETLEDMKAAHKFLAQRK